MFADTMLDRIHTADEGELSPSQDGVGVEVGDVELGHVDFVHVRCVGRLSSSRWCLSDCCPKSLLWIACTESANACELAEHDVVVHVAGPFDVANTATRCLSPILCNQQHRAIHTCELTAHKK
jgi:hypothetical protein